MNRIVNQRVCTFVPGIFVEFYIITAAYEGFIYIICSGCTWDLATIFHRFLFDRKYEALPLIVAYLRVYTAGILFK